MVGAGGGSSGRGAKPAGAEAAAAGGAEPGGADRVAALLARFGAGESDLACGTHTPYFFGATGQTPAPGARYTSLHHNCSGKHGGMLMLAHALGAPLAGYLDVDHPVQQAIANSVAHFSGIAPERLVRGTDGCSAPNYALPLRALAQAFARLTLEAPDADKAARAFTAELTRRGIGHAMHWGKDAPSSKAKILADYPDAVAGWKHARAALLDAPTAAVFVSPALRGWGLV